MNPKAGFSIPQNQEHKSNSEPPQSPSEPRSYTNRASNGVLEFHDYRRRRASRPRVSSDPDRFWQVVALLVGAIMLIAMGFL